ncbi:MAG: hypothetical protein ACJAQT_002695 [Akkermansiaceae bacterium]|jgi:hypothetical protein
MFGIKNRADDFSDETGRLRSRLRWLEHDHGACRNSRNSRGEGSLNRVIPGRDNQGRAKWSSPNRTPGRDYRLVGAETNEEVFFENQPNLRKKERDFFLRDKLPPEVFPYCPRELSRKASLWFSMAVIKSLRT